MNFIWNHMEGIEMDDKYKGYGGSDESKENNDKDIVQSSDPYDIYSTLTLKSNQTTEEIKVSELAQKIDDVAIKTDKEKEPLSLEELILELA